MANETLSSPVPRALYYMNFWTPFRSLYKLLIDKKNLQQGPLTEKFRSRLEDLLGGKIEFVPHARIGLFLILKFLKIDRGSEVLMTPINLPEMLKMIRINGLEAKFIGYKPHSFHLDFSNIEISKKTKIFLYTPISGIHEDMDQIKDFCEKNNLILIQDLTQSFLGKWKNVPIHQFAKFNFMSFCDLKVVHTHRGGIIQTQDHNFRAWFLQQQKSFLNEPSKKYFLSFILEDLISNLILRRGLFKYIGRLILFVTSLLGENTLENLTAGRGVQVGKYKFLTSFMASGNDWQIDKIPEEQLYRYTDLQAEIGLERLERLITREKRRIQNAKNFYGQLEGKARNLIPQFPEDEGHLYWKTPLLVPNFSQFQKLMLSKKIDLARSNLPWLPDLLSDQKVPGRSLRDSCAYVPTHYYLNDHEINYIAKSVNECAKDLSG